MRENLYQHIVDSVRALKDLHGRARQIKVSTAAYKAVRQYNSDRGPRVITRPSSRAGGPAHRSTALQVEAFDALFKANFKTAVDDLTEAMIDGMPLIEDATLPDHVLEWVKPDTLITEEDRWAKAFEAARTNALQRLAESVDRKIMEAYRPQAPIKIAYDIQTYDIKNIPSDWMDML